MMTVKPSYEELEARCDRLARQIVFITDNAQKSVSRIHKELTSRLETAEAQVARVREVCASDAHEWSNEYGSNDWVLVEDILEALDGDGRG